MNGPRYSIIPCQAVYDTRFKLAHYRVLGCLGHYTDENGWCKLKQKTIAERLGYTREAVNRTIRQLETWGYVEKTDNRAAENGHHACSSYRVLMDRKELPSDPMDHEGSDPLGHEPSDLSDHIINDPSLNDPSLENTPNPSGGEEQQAAPDGGDQSGHHSRPTASAPMKEMAVRPEGGAKKKKGKPEKVSVRKQNQLDDVASGYADFCRAYQNALSAAGRGHFRGISSGRRSWPRLSEAARRQRYSSIPQYQAYLASEPWQKAQHISTFLNSGWEDYKPDPAEVERKQIQAIALDLQNGSPNFIKQFGWQDFAEAPADLMAKAKEYQRKEFGEDRKAA